jgi:hypothetical protein
MSRIIWKFSLELSARHLVLMPRGAEILSVQMQGGSPVAWALVDPDAQLTSRVILMNGTGWDVGTATKAKNHIGTVQADGMVWHFFEEAP